MQQTTNFQLSQWDADDRILRTDFNRDNAKIDGALKTEADARKAETAELRGSVSGLDSRAGAKSLLTGKAGSADSRIDLPLDGINWGQWKAVHIDLDAVLSSSAQYRIEVNGNSSVVIGFSGGSEAGAARRQKVHLLFYPLFDARRVVHLLALGVSHPGIVELPYSFAELKSLQMRVTDANYTFGPETSWTCWGEK